MVMHLDYGQTLRNYVHKSQWEYSHENHLTFETKKHYSLSLVMSQIMPHLNFTLVHAANDATAPVRCSSNPCFPGVRCVDTEEGFRCGNCPIGYNGDGITCRRHTTCSDRPCFPGNIYPQNVPYLR